MNPNALPSILPALSSARAFLMELDAAGKQMDAGEAFTARLAIKRLTAAAQGEIAALDAALALATAPVSLKAYDPRWGSPS